MVAGSVHTQGLLRASARTVLRSSNERVELMQLTPLKRFGGEEDLKGVAALLASDASAYITGQVIAVDGGMSAI